MTLDYLHRYTIPAAFALLPPRMDSPDARVLLLAIGLQESKFAHRVQVRGPARGFWQFEQGGGVAGVFAHPRTGVYAGAVCQALAEAPTVPDAYAALAHNDVLACALARLLLWTLPGPLPAVTDAEGAWTQYLAAWRPGKPHPATWAAHHLGAQAAVGNVL